MLWHGSAIGDVHGTAVLRWLEMSLRFWRDRSGSSLIEYSFLITVLAALVVVGVRAAGNWVSGVFSAFSP